MNIERLHEAQAGNLESFARGQSYIRSRKPRGRAETGGAVTPPDIFSADIIRDPYPHYREMRDHHPLYRHEGSNAYILSRHNDVCTALTDTRFTTRSYAAQIEPLLGVTLIQRDGQDHARERRLLAAPFRADQRGAVHLSEQPGRDQQPGQRVELDRGALVVDFSAPCPALPPDPGTYLVDVGGRSFCHGPGLTGGQGPEPGAPAAPDLTSGGPLRHWTEADFVTSMRQGLGGDGHVINAKYMPWLGYRNMTETKFTAIWRFAGHQL